MGCQVLLQEIFLTLGIEPESPAAPALQADSLPLIHTQSPNIHNPNTYFYGDLPSLAPHERLPEILVVPREKTPTGAAARGNP